MLKFKKLLLTGLAIAVTGLMLPSCVEEDGLTFVRFTWERAEQGSIMYIAAGYNNVAEWEREIYRDENIVIEEFTDIPKHNGSRDLPDYNGFLASQTLLFAENKAKYFEIEPGKYTAVCGVEDSWGNIDIVANYSITANSLGVDRYFEVAFDVGALIDGDNEKGWFSGYETNDKEPPYLSKKTATKQIVQKGGTIDIEYFVIRRPKK